MSKAAQTEESPAAVYGKLLNSLRVIVWRADPRTFQTTFASKHVENILGYPVEPWTGTPNFWADRIHPEDRERVLALSASAVAEKRDYDFECRMIASDGGIVWLRNVVTVVVVDNQAVDVLGVAVDISERKQAEEALQESEERFRMAAQAGRMFAYQWDVATDGIVRSDGVAQVLGEDEAEHTTRQHVLTTIPPEDQERLHAALAGLSPEEPCLRISYRMIRSDGAEIWVNRTSRAYFDEKGNMLRLVGMVVDITERKRAEEVLRNMSRKLIEAQDQERARIARELHDDVGQRLALLLIGFQGMKEKVPDSAVELRSHMDDLEKLTSKIAADVQTLSHELHSAQLEYLGLVSAIRGFCAELATKQRVKIRFSEEGIPPMVPPDVSLCLFRIAQEALNNATKHSGVQDFEVKLRGSATEISLVVRDSGVGFDPESARTTQGLGLISMRERVNLVRGTFSVTSRPHSGTEISIRVPLSRAEQTASAGA